MYSQNHFDVYQQKYFLFPYVKCLRVFPVLSEDSLQNCETPCIHIKCWEKILFKRNNVLSVTSMKIAKLSFRWDIKVNF